MAKLLQALGRSQPFVEIQSPPIISQRAPATSDTDYAKGASWLDESVSPKLLYFHLGAGVWMTNQVTLSTDATFAGALDTTASSSLAIKTYADALAIAGAPDASETVKGIAELCTTAEAVAGADTSRIMTSDNVASVFAAPPALGSGTPGAGAFTTLAATGAVDFDGALQVNIASSQASAGAVTLVASNAAGSVSVTGSHVLTPDSITSDNAGVAASINTPVTLITTDGDSNEDNVTLADGVAAGQIKHFAVIAAGNVADSIKITPANMAGGSKITFAADPTGLGCTMVFDGTNWCVVSNNAGTIA